MHTTDLLSRCTYRGYCALALRSCRTRSPRDRTPYLHSDGRLSSRACITTGRGCRSDAFVYFLTCVRACVYVRTYLPRCCAFESSIVPRLRISNFFNFYSHATSPQNSFLVFSTLILLVPTQSEQRGARWHISLCFLFLHNFVRQAFKRTRDLQISRLEIARPIFPRDTRVPDTRNFSRSIHHGYWYRALCLIVSYVWECKNCCEH